MNNVMDKNYLPIIGLEIHVELKTKSKMFCGCKNDPFHAQRPNIYTCPVCLGLPGALPFPNKKAIDWTIKLGLALNCEIPLLSKFDRKNYFYPDLPKGYQISQYDQPFCKNGFLDIKSTDLSKSRRIRINRVHLEEDTGKLLHQTINEQKVTLIDFNRSGVPLVEIVTEPDIHSSEDAKSFLKKLYQIIRYLDISDASMEKGSMRLEPNISVTKYQNLNSKLQINSQIQNFKLPNYKVEVKNINSFNFVKRAIDFEVERHIKILEGGEIPTQETRGWDEKKNQTLSQRSKEGAADYRYFPEPDIPTMKWTQKQINDLRLMINELPDAKIDRFVKDLRLPYQIAERIVEDRELAEYFEKCVSFLSSDISHQTIKILDIANWLINKNMDIKKIKPEDLIKQIADSKNVVQIDNDKLQLTIDEVLDANPKAVSDYKNGKIGVIMFLVGSVIRELKVKVDAQLIKKMLEEKLK
jgi:aspartyl-tRNA(Asn)/glutamyl-tRNA(Gln) amidotransferase subunit B